MELLYRVYLLVLVPVYSTTYVLGDITVRNMALLSWRSQLQMVPRNFQSKYNDIERKY